MEFKVNLTNEKVRQASPSPSLFKRIHFFRLKAELCLMGLDKSMESEPAVINLNRKIEPAGRNAGEIYEIHLSKNEYKYRVELLLDSLRNRLALGGISLMAFAAFLGFGSSTAGAESSALHQAAGITSANPETKVPVIPNSDYFNYIYKQMFEVSENNTYVEPARWHMNSWHHDNDHTNYYKAATHNNGAHANTYPWYNYANVPHVNVAHTDWYNNVSWGHSDSYPHTNTAHTNVSHTNVPHGNTPASHNNVNHTNIPHNNINPSHNNVNHTNNPHSNAHANLGAHTNNITPATSIYTDIAHVNIPQFEGDYIY